MVDCVQCNVCSAPGTLTPAIEQRRVASHVRCFSHQSFTMWRCPHCQSLHSKEDVDLVPYYAAYPFKNHTLDFHTRVGYANRIRLLQKQGVSSTARILDYGCGMGLYVKFLRAHGFVNADGFDPFVPEFSSPEVLNRTYDVVVSHDVIEHVADPKSYLDELIAMVAPGGLLVLGTPNAAEIDLLDESGPSVELSQPYHRHILSEQALLTLAQERGLEPKDIYHRFYFDTLVPTVNTRFMWSYIEAKGRMIDVAVQKPDWPFILSSPRLLFYALFGYFFRVPGNMLITFVKRHVVAQPLPRAVNSD